MTVAIPNETSTKVLSAVADTDLKHAVWFQNFSVHHGLYLKCGGAADDAEFFLAPAITSGSHTLPSSLVVQNTGGDSTLVNASWYAWQDSGGSLNLNCGRW
jgi:hypothetical protein